MIEVRSAMTGRLIGNVLGRLHQPAQIGYSWRLPLKSKPDDQIVRLIALPVFEFLKPGMVWGWAALNSDGHTIEALRQIDGWVDADCSLGLPQDLTGSI